MTRARLSGEVQQRDDDDDHSRAPPSSPVREAAMPVLAPELDPAGPRAAATGTERPRARRTPPRPQPRPGAAPVQTAVPLAPRQQSVPSPTPSSSEGIVPATYGALYSSPPPGTVVAIVLGSVVGFLLLILLIYAALGFGPSRGARRSESVFQAAPGPSRSVFSLASRSRTRPASDHHRPHHHRRHHRRSRRRSGRHAPETVEVRTHEHFVVDNGAASHSPRVVVGPPRPISTPAPAPPYMAAPRPPPPAVAVDDDDDEVVVIEEHSPPPPRRRSRRHSGPSRRSDEERRRRDYRDGEPDRFDGSGASPLRHARREGSRR